MAQDATRRVRLAITSVMDAYGVPYEDVRRSHHPGIRFTVRGQTRTITYGGGDPRAHMNAKTHTRRVLSELGLVPHEQHRGAAQAAKEEGSTMDTPQVVESPPIEELDTTLSSAPVEHIHSGAETLDRPPNDDAEPSLDREGPSAPRFTDLGYVVFSPTKYDTPQVRLSSGRFFAVRLDRDLIADKGTCLVIPFDIPDVVWDMPEHEFRACFAPVTAPPPDVTVSAAPIESISEPVSQHDPVSPPIPEPIEIDDSDDDEPVHFPSPRPSPEPKRGVSPQMGRVLLAMHFLHQQGETEMNAHTIQALLSPVDAKQVSGMLSGAMKLRYVVRNAPPDVSRGTRYRLSAAGRARARSLGTWPYDHRGLAVPPWLRESMTMSA